MSYIPTNWKAGDTVTSAKLNKLEQGVANGGSNMVMMTMTPSNNDNIMTFTLNKTWQEIWDNNYNVICAIDTYWKAFYQILYVDVTDHSITIFNNDDKDLKYLQANSADDYPTYVVTQQS